MYHSRLLDTVRCCEHLWVPCDTWIEFNLNSTSLSIVRQDPTGNDRKPHRDIDRGNLNCHSLINLRVYQTSIALLSKKRHEVLSWPIPQLRPRDRTTQAGTCSIRSMAALIFFIATAQALNIRTGSAILPGRPSPVASAALATSRRDVIGAAAALGFAALGSDVQIAAAEDEVTLPSGLKYTVLKKGSNTGKPVVGDLVAIRFKCSIKSTGAVIDNILDN